MILIILEVSKSPEASECFACHTIHLMLIFKCSTSFQVQMKACLLSGQSTPSSPPPPPKTVTGRKLPCNVRVVAKRTKMCGSFRDLKLTNDQSTTTTLYTIQTEVIHNILVSSPTTGPQIAISTKIWPDLNNRLNTKLLFLKQWVYCFAVSCRKFCLSCPPVSEMAGFGPALRHNASRKVSLTPS